MTTVTEEGWEMNNLTSQIDDHLASVNLDFYKSMKCAKNAKQENYCKLLYNCSLLNCTALAGSNFSKHLAKSRAKLEHAGHIQMTIHIFIPPRIQNTL